MEPIQRALWLAKRWEDRALKKCFVNIFSVRASRRAGRINFTEKDHQPKSFCYFFYQ